MGSFYQPKAVIIDTDFLKSLPARQFTNGMAEVIKHAIIMDKSYFKEIIENSEKIKQLDSSILAGIIYKSCQIKGLVVRKDEKEAGLRQTLNFGHTIGHAIEAASGYEIPHGFSVALGMSLEASISKERGILSDEELKMINDCLDQYGLLESGPFSKLNVQAIIDKAYSDKKNQNNSIKAVLIQQIGKVYRKNNSYSFPITEDEITRALKGVFKG
jgi:3-dehydroquinate synthase